MGARPAIWWRYPLLLTGVFACSTSAILIKASHAPAVVVPAVRLLLAALLLAPLFRRDLRRHRRSLGPHQLRRTMTPAAVLGLHLITWTYGARMTLSAQASLLVNLAPVALPFFLHGLAGERINRAEIIGTVLAMAGVLVLGARDAWSGGDVWGNVVCFGSMLLFAWYLALGRRNRDFPSIWLYVVPVYALSGLLSLVVALPWLGDFAIGSVREWLLLGGLAILPTIVGHSALNASMRHLRGQVVSLCNVGQFIFAGAMGYVFFQEAPHVSFYAASLLIVAGLAVVVFSAPAPPRLR